jgi:hypothetical protein
MRGGPNEALQIIALTLRAQCVRISPEFSNTYIYIDVELHTLKKEAESDVNSQRLHNGLLMKGSMALR